MKFSNFFIPTIKENPSEAKLISHNLMLRSGMIKQETSGIYSWLPLGFRVLKKIISIIENEHDMNNVNQILMPTIQSSEIWKISKRYDSYGKEMLKIQDRHSKELLYGPTNEEMITSIGKQFIKSYKTLPRFFYHVQSKFRDEIRPRFGVMRAREFIMKDAYSFDRNKTDAQVTYMNFFSIYLNIFKKIGLPIIPVRALSGEIGGDVSHEFHLLVDSGESEIFIKERNNLEFEELDFSSLEKLNSFTDEYFEKIGKPNGLLKKKSIELGHIFLFGTKYSDSFDFDIDSDNGKFRPYMGSYGIGISRIPAAIIELSNDEKGIIWPIKIAPFQLSIINLSNDNNEINNFCMKVYDSLTNLGIDVLFDDRNERPGIKFADNDLIGIPYQLIVGKKLLSDNQVTIKKRIDGEENIINSEKSIEFLRSLIND